MTRYHSPDTALAKIELRVIAFSALVGIFIGFLDTVVDYFAFYRGSFIEILFSAVPTEELWKRGFALIVCLIFGIIVARVMGHRLQAERARAESEKQFQLLFEYAPDAIYLHELVGCLINMNRAGEELTGYSRDELRGRRLLESGLLRPQEIPRAAEILSRNARHEETGPDEFTIMKQNGQLAVAEIRTFPVNMRGQTLIMAIARDITQRKRSEREKEQLEEQLRQAQKMESIGRLAGGIAHDFNNLLTGIIGYAELGMLQQKSRGHQIAELQEIISSGHRAAELTRQLLAFSRKQVLAPTTLNLNEIVTRLERMLDRMIGEDILIVTHLDPAISSVRADPVQMEQMLMNLAVNARDAMPDGGRLTFETGNALLDEEYARTHPGVQPGPYVMLSISDTGQGMSADVQSHIFEPFFTTKEKGKGTGLGLSTVYGIVNQHGGHLWLYSDPGHGTIFKIYLPAVDAPSDQRTFPPDTGEERRGTETVLLVEDQETVRKLVGSILTEYGYDVLPAPNAREAVRIANAHPTPIHLLLTDVIMPELNGKELAQQLAARHPHMHVIYMSGYTDDVIVHHGMLEPGTDFLQKPLTVHALTQKVRDVLDRTVNA